MLPCRPWLREPVRPALDHVADPEQRLDIVDERRAPEQADLRDVGRAMPRIAALALDALDHRGFLAADIGAGPATQLDEPFRAQALPLEGRDLVQQNLAHGRVLVAQVDEGALGLDRPCGDQQALQEPVRIAFQIVPVLERAGLALVGVDAEVARLRLPADQAPLAPGREPGATEPAQAGIVERCQDLRDATLAVGRRLVAQLAPEPVAALGGVARQADIVRDPRLVVARLRHGQHHGRLCPVDVPVPDLADRSHSAATHARRRQDTDLVRIDHVPQPGKQGLGAHELAGEAVADPDRHGRRRCLVLAHHVEMGVEGGDLVHLGLRQPHLLGKGRQMLGREMPVMVLDQVQLLDQQVAAPRPVTQERQDLVPGFGTHLPPARRHPPAPSALLPPRRLDLRPMLTRHRHSDSPAAGDVAGSGASGKRWRNALITLLLTAICR